MPKPIRTGWKTWAPVVILKYWLHQSNRYMNVVELTHRWFLEALVFIPLLYFFSESQPAQYAAGLAFLISHTFSATLNGHPFALIAHDLYWLQLYTTRPAFSDTSTICACDFKKSSPLTWPAQYFLAVYPGESLKNLQI